MRKKPWRNHAQDFKSLDPCAHRMAVDYKGFDKNGHQRPYKSMVTCLT